MTAVLLDPGKYAGQLIPVWDEQLTPTELVATFSKVTGQPAKCVYRPAFRVEFDELLKGNPSKHSSPHS